jgi:hypothetical protein
MIRFQVELSTVFSHKKERVSPPSFLGKSISYDSSSLHFLSLESPVIIATDKHNTSLYFPDRKEQKG